MTLDEAIKHAQDVSNECADEMCSREHYQLSCWLIELKLRRETDPRGMIYGD